VDGRNIEKIGKSKAGEVQTALQSQISFSIWRPSTIFLNSSSKKVLENPRKQTADMLKIKNRATSVTV